jgi:hypothetical protein
MGTPAQNSGGASLAAAGLQAAGDIVSSRGIAAGDTFKANILEENAQRGQVAAIETGAAASEQLARTLSNIDAVRAAANTNPTSPTGAAVRDWSEQIGLTQKSIAVDNIVAQSRQQEAEATYLRAAGKTALLSGDISAGAGVLKALGPALGPTGPLAFLGISR